MTMGPNAALIVNGMAGILQQLLAYQTALAAAAAEGRDLTDAEVSALRQRAIDANAALAAMP
jgi:hypothetical protein